MTQTQFKYTDSYFVFRWVWTVTVLLLAYIVVFYFSVRARGDQAAGEPAEDPRVCACEGQPEANTDT